MNRLALIFPLALVCAGCAMTRVHYVEEHELISRINEPGGLRSAEIVMATGERLKAREIVAEYDSVSFIVTQTSWYDAPIGFRRVALSLIGSMTVTNHGEGAVEGVKRATIAGAVVAIGGGLAELEDQERDLKEVAIGAAIFVPLAAAVGLISGAAIGMKHWYVLEPERFESFEKQDAARMSFAQKIVATWLGR